MAFVTNLTQPLINETTLDRLSCRSKSEYDVKGGVEGGGWRLEMWRYDRWVVLGMLAGQDSVCCLSRIVWGSVISCYDREMITTVFL